MPLVQSNSKADVIGSEAVMTDEGLIISGISVEDGIEEGIAKSKMSVQQTQKEDHHH